MKGEANLNAAVERCGVIVTKAPKGMSRNKSNGTKWTKNSQSIQWTVEWVHADGRRELGQCQDNVPIMDGYGGLESAPEWLRSKKRKRTNHRQEDERRRKRSFTNDKNPHQQETTDMTAESMSEENGIAPRQEQDECQGPKSEFSPNGHLPVPAAENAEDQTTTKPITDPEHAEPSESTATNLQTSIPQPPPRPAPPNISFYLHCPSLPSRHPILAPLSHDAMLANSLRNRLVLEFPTIYVFAQPPNERLPEGYISEEEFYKMARKEIIEVIDEGEVFEEISSMPNESYGAARVPNVDERRLVEVLGKDLGG